MAFAMAEKRSREELRRKHCRVDLLQVVTEVSVYNRPLNSKNGNSGTFFGLVHEAAVATTENGKLYLIEKGVDPSDDINYKVKYREGKCRIVEISWKDIRDWKLVRTVENVESGVTLEDLFESCGSEYSLATDNCWNATHRIRARANREEDGMTWQGKAGLNLGFGLAFGIGVGLLANALLGKSNEKKEKMQQ